MVNCDVAYMVLEWGSETAWEGSKRKAKHCTTVCFYKFAANPATDIRANRNANHPITSFPSPDCPGNRSFYWGIYHTVDLAWSSVTVSIVFDNQVRHTSRRECASGRLLTGKGGARFGRGCGKLRSDRFKEPGG